MSRKNLERIFPRLNRSGFTVTSCQTPDYNCIAWAANDTHKVWWPIPASVAFWPQGVPRELTISAFIQAYGLLGYVPCDNSQYEDGYEKLAIYASNGSPTHAARQLPNGRWTSKLGQLEDIEHHAIDGVCGNRYGEVAVVLKRPKRN